MRPAESLEGLELEGGWKVDSILHRPPGSTGGKFSVGYLVINKDGRRAYLKALDYSDAMQQPDPARALEALTKAYNFERDLLNICKASNLSRIVTPLADGTVSVPGFGLLEKVSYLIFELAEGDIRAEKANWNDFDLAWSLRSLHHSAVGLQQLHRHGIAHQDVKPSNVLVFGSQGSKLTDLGRASHKSINSMVDQFPIPGDTGYTPPEQYYGWKITDDFSARCLADLYHLGSLIFFFFLDCSATQAILFILQKYTGDLVNNDYLHDLPYFQYSFNEALESLKASVYSCAPDMADEMVLSAKELCEPDPRHRGNPKVFNSLVPSYDLQAYVSRFDRLARIAENRMI